MSIEEVLDTMDKKTKNEIINLRKDGKGYGEIASITGVSKNTIVSLLRRSSIEDSQDICPVCGKPLMQTKGHRQKKYCSDECRMEWWKEHHEDLNLKAYHTCKCNCCGKEFISYSRSTRRYCSTECYQASRKAGGNNGQN